MQVPETVIIRPRITRKARMLRKIIAFSLCSFCFIAGLSLYLCSLRPDPTSVVKLTTQNAQKPIYKRKNLRYNGIRNKQGKEKRMKDREIIFYERVEALLERIAIALEELQ